VPETTAADGTVSVEPFELSFSSLASDEARAAYVSSRATVQDARGSAAQQAKLDSAELRKQADEQVVLPLLEKQLARWPDAVEIEPNEIDGVYTETFVPKGAESARTGERVLVNLHGGGFMVGDRMHGRLEAIPIAALGQVKVIAIEYRKAPEHTFPAASEDVAIVYRSLLRDYEPHRIGIYGSSSGGILAAQSIAWLLEEGLPIPGAVGMFGGTGHALATGDSSSLAYYVYGLSSRPPDTGWETDYPYFEGADIMSRLAAPMGCPDVLAQFPPSLLITGTRAYELSSMVTAHDRLTLAGAHSRLHVWDGVGHCFYLNPDLPESREVERIVIDFFAKTLGRDSGSDQLVGAKSRPEFDSEQSW
jgi:monoterpene epsilon-lactone hydrolase